MAAPALHAQVGGAAVVFLMIEPDSRAAGMGNANVAIADNANAVFWNPAGLAFQTGASAGITHSNWLPEFNANLFYEYAVGKLHLENIGTLGAHVTYFNLGEHEAVDELGNNIGQFRSYDLAAGLSFGRQLSDNLGLGVSARAIVSNLATGIQLDANTEVNRGVSFGLDLGLLYKSDAIELGSGLASYALGANLANMGPSVGYTDDGARDPIPTNLRFGYAFTYEFDEFNKVTFANDFNKALYRVTRDSLFNEDGTPALNDNGNPIVDRNVDPWYRAIFSAWGPIDVDLNPNNDVDDVQTLNAFDQMTIGAGAEYWYNNLFAMRAGYFYENPYNGNREFVTFGAGLRYNIFGVDFSYIYALEEDHPLSNTMRFSVLLDFQR
jgi:long-subunit fatty acid transport protein